MKRVFSTIFALFLCAQFYAQSPNQAITNKSVLRDSIDKYINNVQKLWQLPGLAASISINDQIILQKGYGVKELTPKNGIGYRGESANSNYITSGGVKGVKNKNMEPIDENTIFQIGSISKSFTATVLAQLVAEGQLSWNDTIKNILPDIKFYDKWVEDNIQVKDIMVHRTGLKGQAGTYLPNLGYDRDDIYKMIGLIKPAYSFRGDYQYNNITFIIAQKIIEKITNRSWEENVEERIFKPAGMIHSSLNASGFASSDNVATPHDYSYTTLALASAKFPHQVKMQNTDAPSIITLPLYSDEQALYWLTGVGPAGSVNSSVSDMIKYAQMHINNGFIVNKTAELNDTIKVISEKAMKYLHRGQTITSEDTNRITLYANCWFVEQNNKYRLYFHTGTTWGMTAICFFVPELKLSGVVLVNSEAGASPRYAIMRRTIDLIMGLPYKDYNSIYFNEWLSDSKKAWDKSVKERNVEPKQASVKAENIVGKYTKDDLFGNAEISQEKTKLFIRIGKKGFKNELVFREGNIYEFRSDGHAFPIIFTMDKDGKKAISFEIDFNYGEGKDFGPWLRSK